MTKAILVNLDGSTSELNYVNADTEAEADAFLEQKKSDLIRMVVSAGLRKRRGSFVYKNKKVRADTGDYVALAQFMHLVEGTAKKWKTSRKWFAVSGFEEIPLPNETEAKEFGVAMLEHKESFTKARIELGDKIRSATSIEELNLIDVEDPKHWPT